MNRRRTKQQRTTATVGPGPDLTPGPGRAASRLAVRERQRDVLRGNLEMQLGRRARTYLRVTESTASLLANRDRLSQDRTVRLLNAEAKRRDAVRKMAA